MAFAIDAVLCSKVYGGMLVNWKAPGAHKVWKREGKHLGGSADGPSGAELS
jgi:hypothetical protein